MNIERIIIVRNKTRLELLIERFNTKAQAKFYIEHTVQGDFSDYELEHGLFYKALESVQKQIDRGIRVQIIDKSFLPNFVFANDTLLIALGQDGLVANAAKYALNIPILGINPDPDRYDGVLLPYLHTNFQLAIDQLSSDKAILDHVTMGELKLNDGQRILAFNDFFIGPQSHSSARYKIKYNGKEEQQSSSGLIISTGAGCTGWFSSVVNMYVGIGMEINGRNMPKPISIDRHEQKLRFVVREPFKSKYSACSIVWGEIEPTHPLELESLMPENGIIFSDGIVEDYIPFNSGMQATIGIAEERAVLVC